MLRTGPFVIALMFLGCARPAYPETPHVALVRCPDERGSAAEAVLEAALRRERMLPVVRTARSCTIRLQIEQPSPISHLDERLAMRADAQTLEDGRLLVGLRIFVREGDDFVVRASPRAICRDENCVVDLLALAWEDQY